MSTPTIIATPPPVLVLVTVSPVRTRRNQTRTDRLIALLTWGC